MDDRDPGPSFEQRLTNARAKQGLDRPPAAGPTPATGLGAGLRIGVEQVSAIAVGVALGWAIDRAAGTRPAFMVVGLFVGAIAGFVNTWRTLRRKGEGEERG